MPIDRITNTDARGYVNNLREFTGSNLFARWYKGVYTVYSYGEHWPLVIFHRDSGRWFVNADKYSASTSRHLSHARPNVPNLETITADGMKALNREGVLPALDVA